MFVDHIGKKPQWWKFGTLVGLVYKGSLLIKKVSMIIPSKTAMRPNSQEGNIIPCIYKQKRKWYPGFSVPLCFLSMFYTSSGNFCAEMLIPVMAWLRWTSHKANTKHCIKKNRWNSFLFNKINIWCLHCLMPCCKIVLHKVYFSFVAMHF